MLSKDNMEEWAKDLPDWVLLSPGLSIIYAEVQSFLAKATILGADPELARQEAIKRLQAGSSDPNESCTFEKVSEQILEEIERGTFQ